MIPGFLYMNIFSLMNDIMRIYWCRKWVGSLWDENLWNFSVFLYPKLPLDFFIIIWGTAWMLWRRFCWTFLADYNSGGGGSGRGNTLYESTRTEFSYTFNPFLYVDNVNNVEGRKEKKTFQCGSLFIFRAEIWWPFVIPTWQSITVWKYSGERQASFIMYKPKGSTPLLVQQTAYVFFCVWRDRIWLVYMQFLRVTRWQLHFALALRQFYWQTVDHRVVTVQRPWRGKLDFLYGSILYEKIWLAITAYA